MEPDPKAVKAAPASVSVTLSDHASVSALLSTIRGAVQERADSVRVSIRGSSSAVVTFLNRITNPGIDVSAVLTMKGDVPTVE